MDFDDLLQCLVESEQGQPRPELTGGRYMVVDYVTPAPAPATSTGTAEAREATGEKSEGAEDHSFDVIGTAPSFYQALDLLGEALGCDEELAELDEEEWAAEMAAELGMDVADEDEEDEEESEDGQGVADSNSELMAVFKSIRAPQRRAVVHLLCGYFGTMNFVTEDFEQNFYLGHVARRMPGAQFVMLASAAPPNQEVAFAILSLRPGDGSEAGKESLTSG
ncbi:hypothetical protein [Streptomyces bluensis]|uniref:hypothetical protein n=1 Tax=Streptomyces bluensis TaxID=33897 RepID=UPI003330BA73